MSAIPLLDNKGTVRAWMCSVCKYPASISHYGDGRAPDERMLAGWRARAESCCRCEVCKRSYRRGGMFTSPACAKCRPEYDRKQAEAEARRTVEVAAEARARAEMLSVALDRDAAERLETMMSDISEDAYCASWCSGLSEALWKIVEGGERASYGDRNVEPSEIEDLRRLSEKAGGWWSDDGFVTLAVWKARTGP